MLLEYLSHSRSDTKDPKQEFVTISAVDTNISKAMLSGHNS